jgi:hypothetical protein
MVASSESGMLASRSTTLVRANGFSRVLPVLKNVEEFL